MKILITGGAGFIGAHVARELVAQGHAVTVLDSLVSGTKDALPEGVAFVEGDIRDAGILRRAMDGVGQIVHLAALVSVPKSIEDPVLTEAVNVEGTKQVFDIAEELGIARIVYASSAAVYGNEPSVPKRETSQLAPLSPYAASKLANEEYARTHAVSSMGLRFFNVYGPGQQGSHPYASVIPRWMEALAAGNPVTLYGDGSQTRDFVHVKDIARAVALALASSERGVVNVATGEERSLRSVVEYLGELRGAPIEVNELPPRAGDIARSFADVSKAKEELGFSPQVSFEKGIQDLMIHYSL